jgi:hypothetical protein
MTKEKTSKILEMCYPKITPLTPISTKIGI